MNSAAIPAVDTLELKGKKVLLRLDLNVPITDGAIDDDTRIREALPTIKYCLEQGARVVICSHLGRPDGRPSKKYSLEPVAARLAELLQTEVVLSDDLIGEGIHQMVRHDNGSAIILLENIRFDAREEENDPEFARQLARMVDVYVSDAFGTAHRKHASTYGVAPLVAEKAVGFLIQKELRYLSKLVEAPAHPYVVIAGGAKVTDKLKALENLLNFVDELVIGGAMAYAFLAAQAHSIGKSKCEAEGIEAAKQLLAKAKARKVKISLPVDHIVAYPAKDPELRMSSTIDGVEIPADAAALDIGPKTVELFRRSIAGAKTIFWNGPMGFFEKEPYGAGTLAIGTAIAESAAVKVAGGGDTLSAINEYNLADRFDLCSTGGGASLKFLEGKGLPGIEILKGK